MMKYFEDHTGNFDESALWAYEGIVIPGGQMIFGRWWSPDEGGIDSANVSPTNVALMLTTSFLFGCKSTDAKICHLSFFSYIVDPLSFGTSIDITNPMGPHQRSAFKIKRQQV